MLDIDGIMEGFDLTTSPATNQGDPLARRDVSTISVKDEIFSLFDDKDHTIDQTDKLLKNVTESIEYYFE